MCPFIKNDCVPEIAALDAPMVLSRKWAQHSSHQTDLRLIFQPPVDGEAIRDVFRDNC